MILEKVRGVREVRVIDLACNVVQLLLACIQDLSDIQGDSFSGEVM